MAVSRQSLTSLVALLDALPGDSEALLLYKHIGISRDDFPPGAMGCLLALEGSDPMGSPHSTESSTWPSDPIQFPRGA